MALPSLLLAILMVSLSYPEFKLALNWPFLVTVDWSFPHWQIFASSVLLFTIAGMAVNALANSFEINGKRHSFAGAYFILLAAMADFSENPTRHLIYVLLFALLLYFCLSIFRKLKKNALLFNIGFVTGILFLLDLNWLPMILFAIVAVNSLNFLKFNEFLLFLVSAAIPLFYKYLYISLYQSPPENLLWLGSIDYALFRPGSIYQGITLASFVILSIILLGGMPGLISSMRIGPKKYLWVVQYLLGFILFVVLLHPEFRNQVFLYGALPVAIVIGCRVSHVKKNQADLFWFYLLLLLFILMRILKSLPNA
jgi:hypothetical protein